MSFGLRAVLRLVAPFHDAAPQPHVHIVVEARRVHRSGPSPLDDMAGAALCRVTRRAAKCAPSFGDHAAASVVTLSRNGYDNTLSALCVKPVQCCVCACACVCIGLFVQISIWLCVCLFACSLARTTPIIRIVFGC